MECVPVKSLMGARPRQADQQLALPASDARQTLHIEDGRIESVALMSYPPGLQERMNHARQDLDSVHRRVGDALDAVLAHRQAPEDLNALQTTANDALQSALFELSTRLAWFCDQDIISLLSWIDLSPPIPDKLEALRGLLWEGMYPLVRDLDEFSRDISSYAQRLNLLRTSLGRRSIPETHKPDDGG